MTQEEQFTLTTLHAFTGCDFEAYRDRGETFRQRLSGAVLNALQLPDSWQTDCEMRGEWGGAHPVHLRLTRADAAGLAVELVSPSATSPLWCAVLNDLRTRSSVRLCVSYQFEPAVICAPLEKIAEYTRAGFTGAGELIAAMRMGGHAL